MKSLLALATIALLSSAVSTAVQAQYRRQPRDTLRYHEVSRTTITLETPQGTIPMSSLHDATIAVAFGSGDTATAWYEALTLALGGPTGDLRPETGPVLRQPFVLRFDARGRIATLRSPDLPASIKGVSDLTKQFADFFLRLPADFDLTRGRVWRDTVIQADTAPDGRISAFRREIEYRALGDTTVAGRQARIVRAQQAIRITSVGPVPGQSLTARSELSGDDSGSFVFVVASGLLLGRAREGHLAGSITYEGGPQPVAVRQRFDYTNSVDLLR